MEAICRKGKHFLRDLQGDYLWRRVKAIVFLHNWGVFVGGGHLVSHNTPSTNRHFSEFRQLTSKTINLLGIMLE